MSETKTSRPLDLDALRALHSQTTKGPLEACRLDADGKAAFREYTARCVDAGANDAGFYMVTAPHPDGGLVDVCHTGNGPTSEANAHAIAAALTAIPALLDEVARLRAQRSDADRLEALTQRHGRIRVDGGPGERWRIAWATDGGWIESSVPTLSAALDVAEGWGREEESHD